MGNNSRAGFGTMVLALLKERQILCKSIKNTCLNIFCAMKKRSLSRKLAIYMELFLKFFVAVLQILLCMVAGETALYNTNDPTLDKHRTNGMLLCNNVHI